MDNVVKPLIKKHFYFIITREGNKLDLVPKGLWMSYQAKVTMFIYVNLLGPD